MRRLALLLLLLPLAACGDDGPTLEERRAEYVRSAEAVCADANRRADELGDPLADLAGFADGAVAIARDTVEGVTALEPPEEDRAELTDKVLDPLRADLPVAEAFAEKVKTAAASGDRAALIGLLGQLPQPTADTRFMTEYGLTQCVEAIRLTG